MVWWIYRLLLPAYLILVLPGWLIKMARRGGFGSGLLERFGWFCGDREFEPCGAIHVHAVSVGEALLGLKLIDAWRRLRPERSFVLAVATSSGHAVACEHAGPGLRVVYQPVDLKWCVSVYLTRFEPSSIVLVEGEMWPNLLRSCRARAIPVRLANARMSPRSRRRYQRFAAWIRPLFGLLDKVALQEAQDVELWRLLGVERSRSRPVGSMKFDPGERVGPQVRKEFEACLASCAGGRPVVLGASTHAGEEVLVARAAVEAGAFALIVPRHAERRAQVRAALEQAGLTVALRSESATPAACQVLVVDTTGELSDWTAHADLVVIGKSFRGTGGQNPAEAVQAGKPLLFGPHMENFEPLAEQLVNAGGAWRITDDSRLSCHFQVILGGGDAPDPESARQVLSHHAGAIARTIEWLES